MGSPEQIYNEPENAFVADFIGESNIVPGLMIHDELVEIWEANLDEPASSGSNKFKGKYFQGYVTELEKTSNAEDMVEVSLTFGVNGTGEKGDVTVTAAQQEVAAYVFTDTTKTGA